MKVYFAAVHKDEASDYTALFPGVPGCITAGASLEELAEMAQEALRGHLEVSRDFGDTLPEPLTLAQAKNHEDGAGAEFFLAIPVDVETGRSLRLNITLPEGLVHGMDDYARRRGMSRSAFIAKAARQAMRTP